ncbi:hypothetical protein [uncultured Bifidobacterium sp.]|uniref:hypothetical protein n=1 Tax=uncultured Bifidobacterium sp. TaxID=165187 RepID=UPI00258AF6F8|nr:hypothetical protein [uncultured Bifidobacterium sp.]
MNNIDINEANCGRLFAEHYLEGVNWHAQKINLIDTTSTNAFENCYHIGAALEMYIYALIAWDDPLQLVDAQTKTSENSKTTTLQALIHNQPDISRLSKLQVASVNHLLPIVVEKITGRRNTQSGLGLFMQQILQARNDVVHRNIISNSTDYLVTRFIFIKDSIRQLFGEKDLRYLALEGLLPDNKPALSRLLAIQINNLQKTHTFPTASELQAKYSSTIGIIKSEADSYATSYEHGRHCTEIVSCPVCAYPSFMLYRTTHMATAPTGIPNNSPSILAAYSNNCDKSENELICAACDLTWKETELIHYSQISQVKQLIPSFDSKQIKTKKSAILQLAEEAKHRNCTMD